MHLDVIKKLISESSPADWNIIGPPTFSQSFGYWTNGRRDTEDDFRWGLDVHEHYLTAAYKPNVNLGIVYGMEELGFDRREPWTPDWAVSNPDKKVTPQLADIRWCGMLIERHFVLSVDGGRAILPDPRPFVVHTGDVLGYEQVGDTVSQWKVDLARVVHTFEHQLGEFETYLSRAGFVVIPDAPGPSRDW